MINKLRNKLVFVNLLLVSGILFLAMLVLFINGFNTMYHQDVYRIENSLDMVMNGESETFIRDATTRDIVVMKITENETQYYSYKDTQFVQKRYDSYIEYILKQPDNQGALPILNIRYNYHYDAETDTTFLAVQDILSLSNKLGRYVLLFVIALGVSLVSFYFISKKIAQVAMQPLEESLKKQRQFVADASHELKTPLAVITANNELIASHPDETVASQQKWIDNTRQEAQRMSILIKDLLFLAKHDDGLKVTKTALDISRCVTDMALTYESIFFENGKTFDYDIQSDLEITANEQQIKQLVAILLDNANKYAINDGKVILQLKGTAKAVTLKVSNLSNKLSDEQLAHLFDRFYTIDQSRNKDSSGNGLGLSIAKTICTTHNGTINARYNNDRIEFTATFNIQKKQI